MRSRWLVYVLIFSVAVNIAAVGTLVYYWTRPGRPPGGFRHGPKRDLAAMLDLEKAQQVQLDSLRRVYFERLKPLRKELRRERARLSAVLEQNAVDSLILKQHIARIAELQARVELETAKHLHQMQKLLTPEQRAKFRRFLRDRMKMRRHPPR